MRLPRRQTRFEELPASELSSLRLEDALCGTHLLGQVLFVNLLHPNKANDDQPVPIRPDCRPTEGQRILLSHPTHWRCGSRMRAFKIFEAAVADHGSRLHL